MKIRFGARCALLLTAAGICLGLAAQASAQTITVVNSCSYTVYPGIYPADYQNGGWEMAPGTSVTFSVPQTFNGRIWGRTGCNSASPAQCTTGQCGGTGLQCAGTTGQAGTSLAEFNLDASGTDWYDVSYVDGFDNPIGLSISNPSCASPNTCTDQPYTQCSSDLLSGGYCLSPCTVYNTDQYCCRNAYGTSSTCQPSTWPANEQAYVNNIHSYCPGQYSYAYDDSVGLHTCPTGNNYTVTFCPNGSSSSGSGGGGSSGGGSSTTPGQNISVGINGGGNNVGAFTWDQDVSGGNTASTANSIDTSLVSAPVPPQNVFQTERWGDFTYTIGGFEPNAQASVNLYFAEIYWCCTGQRQFNVIINGNQVLTNFDIVAAAGGPDRAIQENFSTNTNSSGQVVIQFTQGAADWPKVSGIMVTAPEAQCGVITDGQELLPGEYQNSCDGRFQLIQQPDGNLVLYEGGTALWASGTWNQPTVTAILQSDGNLVQYTNSGANWASGTNGNTGDHLAVQTDGNLVIYNSSGSPIWASNTCCH